MTPAQMLAKLKANTKMCEPPPPRLADVMEAVTNSKLEPCDHCGLYMGHTSWCTIGRAAIVEKAVYGPIETYAQRNNRTYSECLATRHCPICGGDTTMELDMTDQSKEYHWCTKHSGHAWEYDKENNLVDRVPL